MNVLITGANGFLGQHLTLFLAKKNMTVAACSRGECRVPKEYSFDYFPIDLTDQTSLKKLVAATKPAVIIHTAAMSKPDECNEQRAKCLLHNVEVTRYLAEAALQLELKPHFIYISTDFVFGEDGPHSEDDEKGPLNFYGESKLMSETLVAASGLDYTVIRPVFIYGKVWPGLRPSFLHWVKQNLEAGKHIKVVSDQRRTPTYVEDICNGIYTIIQQRQTGVFHLAGKDVISPYQMAVTVAETLGLDAAIIENVTSESFTEPVKRAKRSGLKIDKARQMLLYDPVDFAEGVKLTFNT